MDIKIVSKISTAKVYGKVRLADNESEKTLYVVVGQARSVLHGASDYGEWTALQGDFIAERGEQRYRSGKCFLPANGASMVESQLQSAEMVEFAFRVGVKANDTPIGYEFILEPLIAPTESDPLEQLISQIPEKKLEHKPRSKESRS